MNSTADAHNTIDSNKAHVCKDAAGKCTLRAAIEAANANSGHVDKIVVPKGTVTLSLGVLEPTNSVLIVGAGSSHTTISGANLFEIFQVSAFQHSIAVEIDGVTMTHGKATEGGAVYLLNSCTLSLGADVLSHNTATEGGAIAQASTDSSLWLSNSVVTANSASLYGGGLYLAGGAVQLSNDTIGGSKASAGNRSVAYGGGIYNENSVVSVINTKVDWNGLNDPIDLGNGGGIDNEDVLSMQGGSISHNSIQSPDGAFGGGLYNDDAGQYNRVVIDDNVITASEGSDGGGIVNHGYAKFVNSDVDNNTIKDFGTGYSDDGGGLYNSFYVLWTGGSISGNAIRPTDTSAGLVGEGGGIFDGGTGSGVAATITGTKIEGNTVVCETALSTSSNEYEAGGGALYSGSGLSLSHDAFEHNSASGYYVFGGAVDYHSSDGLSASYLDVGHTTAKAVDEAVGGGIYSAGNLALTNSTLHDNSNTATGLDGGVSGGAIFDESATEWSNVTITNTTNTSSGQDGYVVGGAASLGASSNLDHTKMLNTTDSASRMDGSVEGGVLYLLGNSTMVAFEIDQATATVGKNGQIEGGGVFIASQSFLTIDQGSIANVVSKALSGSGALVDGGAVYVNQLGVLNLTNVTLTGDRALSSGTGKNGGARGGAIYANAPVTLLNDTLNNNWAGRSGGAVYSDGAPVSFKNTIVASNPSPSGSCGGASGGPWFVSSGHNLGTSTSCELTNIGDLNSKPRLGKLQANGGFVMTEAELTGSKSIDAGTDNGCPSIDARGVARPQGKSCDIGAFESQSKKK